MGGGSDGKIPERVKDEEHCETCALAARGILIHCPQHHGVKK